MLITGARFQTIDGPLDELDCVHQIERIDKADQYVPITCISPSFSNRPTCICCSKCGHVLSRIRTDWTYSNAKNTYSIDFSLDFSMPFASSATMSPTEKSYFKLDLAPSVYANTYNNDYSLLAAEQHMLPVDWRKA